MVEALGLTKENGSRSPRSRRRIRTAQCHRVKEMREGAHVRPVWPVSFVMNSLIVRRTIVARIIITVLTVFSVLAMFQVFC